MGETIRERLLAKLKDADHLPSLPVVVTPLVQYLEKPIDTLQVEVIARLISQDESLAAQCLHLANSPLFGRWTPVETIRGAVLNLGLRRMREIAMSCYLLQLMPTAGVMDPTLFWEHALGVALASRRFATEIGFPGPDKAYLAGLLHDFGIIMNLWMFPEEWAKVFAVAKNEGIPLAEAEIKCLGFTHCEVGQMLGSKWHMPEDILQVIIWHHEPEKAPEEKALVALVSLADLLCRMSGIGYGYVEARQIVFSEQPAFQVLLNACPDLKKLDWEKFTLDMEGYLGEVERLVKLVYRPV